MVDPTLALPYWDSTLDRDLPTGSDSIIWSDAFMGTTDNAGNPRALYNRNLILGNLNTGPFAQWRTLAVRF